MDVGLRPRCLMAIVFLLGIGPLLAQVESPSSSAAEAALERELYKLLADHADSSSDPRALVRLADLYLDLGDE